MKIDGIQYTEIGHGIAIAFVGWYPDRALNPRYSHFPDVEKYCILLSHECKDGELWSNACVLDGEVSAQIEARRPRWTVENWEPLTLSPSLLCRSCGRHGFIREGRWIPA